MIVVADTHKKKLINERKTCIERIKKFTKGRDHETT